MTPWTHSSIEGWRAVYHEAERRTNTQVWRALCTRDELAAEIERMVKGNPVVK